MKTKLCLLAIAALGPLALPLPRAEAAVLISEVQTGNAARADEFIELHNAGAEPVDLTGWQLRYLTAEATSAKTLPDPTALIKLTPLVTDGTATPVPANGYYLLYSGAIALPAGVTGQPYQDTLPATGGSLVLLRPDQAACELVSEDALAWGATSHLFGKGEALVAGNASSDDRLSLRYLRADGAYSDTGINATDFLALAAAALPPAATPGLPNTQLLPELPAAGSGTASLPLPARIANPDCTPPPDPVVPVEPPAPPAASPPAVSEPPIERPGSVPGPAIPAGNAGLQAPLLSEFLPNPAPPATDKAGEFIELYNANDASFDLSGYMLAAGPAAKRRYTIPAGTRIAPDAFQAFFSADTKLALANSGSQVSLIDPLGRVLVTSEAYTAAKDGQAWVLADGKWRWTVKPTPGALNVISAPPAKKTGQKTVEATLVAGQSTEVKSRTGGASPAAKEDAEPATAAAASSPLHPSVLALIAASALLYGAYEYRHDLANKLYQLRSHRAARRAARQGAEGR